MSLPGSKTYKTMFSPLELFKITVFGKATGRCIIKIVRNLKYRLHILVYLGMLGYVHQKGERIVCEGGPKDESAKIVSDRCYTKGLLYPLEKLMTLFEMEPYDCYPQNKHPEFL